MYMSKIFKLNQLPKRIKIPTRGLKIKGDPSSKGKSEAQIEREICAWLTEFRAKFWKIKIKGDPFMTPKGIRWKKNKNKGFADIHVCHRGKAIYLEVKKCGGIASEDQLKEQREVRENMGIYEFVTSVTEARGVILAASVDWNKYKETS